eukprot:553832_1
MDRQKYVDEYTELVVGYFIRKSQEILPANIPFYIIAPEIYHLCIQFYYNAPYDRFIHYNHMKAPRYSLNANTCVNNAAWTVYGELDIYANDPCVYRWTFLINYLSNRQFHIGIASNKCYVNGRMNCIASKHKEYKYYAYGADATVFDFVGNRPYKYGTKYYTNNKITMELHVPNKTLVFFKNNEFQGVVDNNINFSNDTQYSMAISGTGKNSVQLIKFDRWIDR